MAKKKKDSSRNKIQRILTLIKQWNEGIMDVSTRDLIIRIWDICDRDKLS